MGNMGNWNYRLVDLSSENGGEPWLALREVYYHEDGSLMGYVEICTGSETLDGVRQQAKRFLDACDQPVLRAEDFPAWEAA